jgi:Fe-coproporphyrin III synthase
MLGRLPGFLRAVSRNRRRDTDLPRFLTYIVTFGCNARCIMCDSWKKSTRDDLQIDEIERIFRDLPRMDGVRLTGGEPFARTDLGHIASLARTHLDPLFLHVTTNGFLTDRIVRFCEERDQRLPLQLLVSVDGVGEKHNAIRGQTFAWRRVMETIDALAPRRRELRMTLAVNQTVVDAEGAEQYRELRELLKPHGVLNHVVMAYDVSATYSTEDEVDLAPTEIGQFFTFGKFTKEQLKALFDQIEEDLPALPWTERAAKRYYLAGIRARLLHDRASPNPPCVALSTHLRLFPDGSVPTCQFNSTRAGTLRGTSFDAFWNSGKRARQREWVKACAGCWAECEVLPNAVYTGDLLWRTSPRAAPVPSGPETIIA